MKNIVLLVVLLLVGVFGGVCEGVKYDSDGVTYFAMYAGDSDSTVVGAPVAGGVRECKITFTETTSGSGIHPYGSEMVGRLSIFIPSGWTGDMAKWHIYVDGGHDVQGDSALGGGINMVEYVSFHAPSSAFNSGVFSFDVYVLMESGSYSGGGLAAYCNAIAAGSSIKELRVVDGTNIRGYLAMAGVLCGGMVIGIPLYAFFRG